ncbi:MAG: hypothetical protein U9N55_10185 [candidate division Zixibacteria bacterium]|nr:hypothetical protein [candidate division Zixibacteria bacterium]
MKGSRLIAVSMLLLMVFACFLSVPAFAEGPWDVDNNSNDGQSTDTSDNNSNENEIVKDSGDNSGFDEVILKIMLKVVIEIITHSGVVNTNS